MAVDRARIQANPPQDVFTPAQLLVEAERVLKRPSLADGYSANQKQQLNNVLLEFSSTVENIDGRPLARKVEYVARTLTGTHDRSPVTPLNVNQWQHSWDTKFDDNSAVRDGYRQGLRAAVITFYGAVGLKKAPKSKKSKKSRMSRMRSPSKSKSRNRRYRL